MTVELIQGNALDVLRTMPDESVHCIITSPPYWGLRAYGTEPQIWLNGHEPCAEHQWETVMQPAANGQTTHAMIAETLNGKAATRRPKLSDTCTICGAWRGELGLEPSPEMFVDHLVQIFREAQRVLRGDGSLWLNVGDSYAGSGCGTNDYRTEASRSINKSDVMFSKHPPQQKRIEGLKAKDLVGIPWMLAFALRADGWYLRSDIIWAKPNPMPESVRDRPTRSHEYLFLLTKSPRYYYDADAIKEPCKESSVKRISQPTFDQQTGGEKDYANGTNPNRSMCRTLENFAHGPKIGEKKHVGQSGRMYSGNDWVPSRGFKTKPNTEQPLAPNRHGQDIAVGLVANKRDVWFVPTKAFREAHFATFNPALIEPCVLAGCPVGGIVLDPFSGAGTTGLIAIQHGRSYIGIELKPEYIEMTRKRLALVQVSQ